MKNNLDATLGQGIKVLQLIRDKETPTPQLQALLDTGLMADLLDANTTMDIDRNAFRAVIGLDPIPVEPVVPVEHIVDTDALPRIPDGLYLTGEGTKHIGMGKVKLEKRDDGKLYANGREVVRYLSPNQQNGNTIQGHKLRTELEQDDGDKVLLNATIGFYLYDHPELIPDDWDGWTYFWDTIFRNSVGNLAVLVLLRDGSSWHWRCSWLGLGWSDAGPAARLA